MITLSPADAATALFCSSASREDTQTPQTVEAAIAEALMAYSGLDRCVASAMYHLGEHPEAYRLRMTWARSMVADHLLLAPAAA